MITTSTIQTLGHKYQTTELNIRREYVQHLFLSYFYRQSYAGKIFFKGGTALRIIYNSPRFSEDLDFSTLEHDIKKIEDCVLHTLHEVEREGIKTQIGESKETSGGYFAILNFQLDERLIAIQIEISFRERHAVGELISIVNDFILPYTLMQLSQKQLIAEKIRALLYRKKPRDFYDLYFILRANLLPTADKKVLPKALAAMKNADINFERELKQFLPKSHWAIIRDFEGTLKREIER